MDYDIVSTWNNRKCWERENGWKSEEKKWRLLLFGKTKVSFPFQLFYIGNWGETGRDSLLILIQTIFLYTHCSAQFWGLFFLMNGFLFPSKNGKIFFLYLCFKINTVKNYYHNDQMLSASKLSLCMHEKSEWKSENSEEILVKTYRCYIWSKEKNCR